MIILDTNVLSETMRPSPSLRVAGWLRDQPVSSLFATTISQAEILYGVALLPAGRRHDALSEQARAIFDVDFTGRILAFDSSAAGSYPPIMVDRRRIGRPISVTDAQIAAIARSRGAKLATRNVRDFEDCGIEVINPWNGN